MQGLYVRHRGPRHLCLAQQLHAVATGRKGSPTDLAIVADMALIQRFVQDTAQHAVAASTSP